ncbi:hypothetical protein MRX96_042017 [Rhipicephalus microplus]
MVQYMKTLSKSKLPDVIALQEPFNRAQLPGYVACGSPCECTRKDIKTRAQSPGRTPLRIWGATTESCA